MSERDWFAGFPDAFEGSVRLDRTERSAAEHRERAISSYHVTADSGRFLGDFFARLLGESADTRTGSNYWLYGYHGSGKSHLLTVLDGLMDSAWLDSRAPAVWDDLTGDTETEQLASLRDQWERVHADAHAIPVSVNLLTNQGQKQRSFSEIVLRHAHQNPVLTGVDDDAATGFSSQLDVRTACSTAYRTRDGPTCGGCRRRLG